MGRQVSIRGSSACDLPVGRALGARRSACLPHAEGSCLKATATRAVPLVPLTIPSRMNASPVMVMKLSMLGPGHAHQLALGGPLRV
jgi:hypothetical protein